MNSRLEFLEFNEIWPSLNKWMDGTGLRLSCSTTFLAMSFCCIAILRADNFGLVCLTNMSEVAMVFHYILLMKRGGVYNIVISKKQKNVESKKNKKKCGGVHILLATPFVQQKKIKAR